jgi:Group II intron, maturase-specific domain
MQYYGAFYRSELYPLLSRINAYVMRWIRNKYKRLRTTKKAKACLAAHHPPTSAALRPLGMGAWLLAARMTGAR